MSILKRSFCSISLMYSKVYPRNINYMVVVKFLEHLDLEEKLLVSGLTLMKPINEYFTMMGYVINIETI